MALARAVANGTQLAGNGEGAGSEREEPSCFRPLQRARDTGFEPVAFGSEGAPSSSTAQQPVVRRRIHLSESVHRTGSSPGPALCGTAPPRRRRPRRAPSSGCASHLRRPSLVLRVVRPRWRWTSYAARRWSVPLPGRPRHLERTGLLGRSLKEQSLRAEHQACKDVGSTCDAGRPTAQVPPRQGLELDRGTSPVPDRAFVGQPVVG